LEEFLKMDSDAVIIMITAYATFDTAIAAWEHGAFLCIRKPFQNEQISLTVAAGVKQRRKEEERQTLRRAMSRAVDRGAIVGRSDVMQEVFRLVEQVAPARSTVLITGESGTGKELIAKAIHEASPRWEAFRYSQQFQYSFRTPRVGTFRSYAWSLHGCSGGEEGTV